LADEKERLSSLSLWWKMTEETLFAVALEKRTRIERAAFLDEACAGDAALRRRVEALLKSHEHASFLKIPAIQQVAEANGSESTEAESMCSDSISLDLSVALIDSSRKPGTRDEKDGNKNLGRVGRYKLLQEIGGGGMGTVYMAEQEHPVRRRVALKIIKAGMDTRQVIARFEAERQALALMDHPNIARVFDAGATESGRPYFVMELVRGIPITRFCDENRLTPRQRLELFVPVCQAVQHAHQKGIIHRDLKPSNVLIGLYDGEPAPKVIDFGVAKATGPRFTEETLYTEFGAVVGTLEYMSPEQAELNQLDIDTRSDIYSLGVRLYELLTGTTPLRRNRLERPALLEALRIIREEEPPRPSTRLSTTAELPSIAANRSVEPRRLSGLVRGELDWIAIRNTTFAYRWSSPEEILSPTWGSGVSSRARGGSWPTSRFTPPPRSTIGCRLGEICRRWRIGTAPSAADIRAAPTSPSPTAPFAS
jgi:serine/threonine protein kinase